MNLYLDIETEPIEHGKALPQFAVAGYAYGDGPVQFTTDAGRVRALLRGGGGIQVVCHRGAFEHGVLGLNEQQFADTAIRGTILGAASGDHDAAGHSLEDLAVRAGADKWKQTRGAAHNALTLSFRPGQDFTELQLAYLRHDVEATRRVYLQQGGTKVVIPDVERQTRWSCDVFKLSRAGICIDQSRLAALMAQAKKEIRALAERLRAVGIIQARGPKKEPWRKMSVSALTVQKLLEASGAHRRAAKGTGVALASDGRALKSTGNPWLLLLAEFKTLEKWLTLLEGYSDPAGIIRTRYNSLVTTGRMSSSSPNVQQVPGHGGLRECWVPRSGHAFVEADYKALELYTFADTCAHWGIESSIRSLLNNGEDVHQVIADRAGLTRKLAKVLNFGGLGGIGPATMAAAAEKEGLVCPPEALKAWRKALPEFEPYKKRATAEPHPDNVAHSPTNRYYVTSPQSGRRRLSTFCSTLNFGFQSPGSDVIKRAIELCVRAGVPVVAALHDQLLADVPHAEVRDVQVLLPQLMKQAGEEVCHNMTWPLPEVHVFQERWASKKD